MADAKIITYGELISATTGVVPDNQSVALNIESTDAEKYVSLDTTDNASKVLLLSTHTAADNESSGFVGIRNDSPNAPLHILGTGGDTGATWDPTTNHAPTVIIENAAGNSKDRCLLAINGDTGTGGAIDLFTGDTRRLSLWSGTTPGIRGQTGTFTIDTSGAQALILGTAETTRLHISSDGKIATGGETTALCSAGGIHIYDSDTGGTANTYADNLVIESTTHPGIQILGPGRNTIAFGDPQNNFAGEMRYSHGAGDADMWFFRMHGATAMCLDHDHKMGLNHELVDASAQLTVTGSLTTALPNQFTNSGTAVTSVAHNLVAGAAVKLPTGTSSAMEVFTVASITSADVFVVDSAPTENEGSAVTGYTDPSLFKLLTGDGATALEFTNKRVLIINDTKDNTFIGDADTGSAILSGAAINNVGVGAECLKSVTTGDGNTAVGRNGMKRLSTGSNNTSIGAGAGDQLTTQGSNTCLGVTSGYALTSSNNTAVGWQSGYNATTGGDCTFLGYNTTVAVAGDDNSIVIGSGAVGQGSDTIMLGNSAIDSSAGLFCYDEGITSPSDERVKDNIADSEIGLDFINALRPVTYEKKHPSEFPEEIREGRWSEWTDEEGVTHAGDVKKDGWKAKPQVGLIAQEVEAVISQLGIDFQGHATTPTGMQHIKYVAFVAPLIKAVQELTARIEELENGD